jgi:hypothetical protein
MLRSTIELSLLKRILGGVSLGLMVIHCYVEQGMDSLRGLG